MTTKSHLRSLALQDRQLLSEEEFQKRNNSLIEQLQKLVVENNLKIIHTFLPISKNREPDMASLFESWWKKGRKIMVSKTDFKSKQMTHYWLNPETELETNSWGIPEPVKAEPADFNDADLVIVPLLVGDKHGNRIGYGGGYYDKLLKGFRGRSAGLSLLPLVDRFETNSWDVPLDVILFPE